MSDEAKTFYEMLSIEKFNPYHDSRGRFTTGGGAASFTIRTKDPSKQHWADMAVAREKEKDSASQSTATKPQTNRKPTEEPQNEETPRTKALHSVEDKIRKQNYESAAIIDDEGNELLFKDGQKSSVGFSRLECLQMQNATLTHNHPRCSMFSPEDLNCMTANGMYEIRATNRDGTTYSMRRADGGYSTEKAMQFIKAYAAEYPKSTKYAQNDLDEREFYKKIWSGEVTTAEANIEFGRTTAKYMAEYAEREAPKYGLVFTVEQRTVTTKKSMGEAVMKSTQGYLVLDRDTNDLEDKAFQDWLDKAQKERKTAKSFYDALAERSE